MFAGLLSIINTALCNHAYSTSCQANPEDSTSEIERNKMATPSYADALKKPEGNISDETIQRQLQQGKSAILSMAKGRSDVQGMSDETEPQADRITKPELSTVRDSEHTDTGEDSTVEEADDEGENDSENEGGPEAEETHWSSKSQLPIIPGMTLQALQNSHVQEHRKWTESKTGQDSCAAFRDALQQSTKVEIQTCVALGLGSFSGDHRGNKGNLFDASMAQLVAFEAYVAIIAMHQG